MTRFTAILLALSLVANGALAASPEADYLEARDKAVAAIKALQDAKASESAIQAAEDKATADLTKQLKDMIGPVAVAGFAPADQINIALREGQGFGNLDGLVSYRKVEATLVVTTLPLLRAWLEARAKDADKKGQRPTEVDAAVREDDFYTGSLYSDVNFLKFVDLPVKKPASADLVFAALGELSQGFGSELPNTIVATVVKGDRVFVTELRGKIAIAKIAACAPIWAKAQRMQADVDDPIEKNYRACFGGRAPKERFFADLTKAAQSLVDRVAGDERRP